MYKINVARSMQIFSTRIEFESSHVHYRMECYQAQGDVTKK